MAKIDFVDTRGGMDIDQLIAFDKIVREGSFSRAAWELHIAQPTISARIQALEQALGGPLFVRSNRRVALTDLGTSFLPYARQALDALNQGVEAARMAQAGERGRLAICVLGSLTGSLLAPVLAAFQRTHPRVECYVRAGSHQRMVEFLSEGVVEVGLIAWPCVDPLAFELTPLVRVREPVVLVAPAGHPLAQTGSVTLDELTRWCDPLVLVRWWQVTPAWMTRLIAQAVSVLNVPPETGRALVGMGVGIGFFTRPHIAEQLAANSVCEVHVSDLAPPTRELALVHLARSTALSPLARDFAQLVREHNASHAV